MSMENWLGKNNTALAIFRVSSRRQDDGISKDVQRAEVHKYCAEFGLRLLREEEITESAKDSEERKKYHSLLDWALKNKIRHILFYMGDREARNLTDNEANEKLVRQDLIVLHYVRERKALHHASSDSDFMIRDIQAVQNKQYSRVLRTKVTDAMRYKAECGWYPSNKPPLGYAPKAVLNDEGRERKRGKIIDVDPNEKNVRQVVREFELRAQGLSYEEIRKRIIQEGFIPPDRIYNYHASGIENRIKNPFYRGDFIWEGVEYKGKHPLIIPTSIIQAVDATINKKTFTRKEVTDENVFGGGWLRCTCGCVVVHDPKVKKNKSTGVAKVYSYYHCTNTRSAHPSLKGMNLTESNLWEQFGQVVESISISDELAHDIAEAMNETHLKAKAANKRQMEGYREALRALDMEDDQLYEDLKKGILDDELFRRQRQKVKEKRLQFSVLLEEATNAITDAVMETVKSVLELARSAKGHWKSQSPLERRKLLDQVCSNPVLDGLTVRYEMKKPFAVLSQMAVSQEWRTHQGSNLGPLDP